MPIFTSNTTGSGSVATDTIFDAKGDLAVGTGADTSAKLTVGANNTIPIADSGQATGIRWTATLPGMTFTDTISFTGTTHPGVRLNNLTTTQRDNLTPLAGYFIWNTTSTAVEVYNGSAWTGVAGSGSVATDTIFDAAGDIVQGTGSNTSARLAIGTAFQLLQVNAGATALEYTSTIAPITVNATTANVTTLKILDNVDQSHGMSIVVASDLTADRTLTVTTGDASRAITLFGDTTIPVFGQQITFAGPTAARTITVPDANFTVARTDAANTFTGVQTMTAPVLVTKVQLPTAAGSSTLSTGGDCAYNTTNKLLGIHNGTKEVGLSTIYRKEWSFDPKAVCDGAVDRLFLMKLGVSEPFGIHIVGWDLSFEADPTTEVDLDLKRADAFIGVANSAVMDVLDTTAGVSSETSSANINGDAVVANGKVIYLEFGTAYTEANHQCIFSLFYTLEED